MFKSLIQHVGMLAAGSKPQTPRSEDLHFGLWNQILKIIDQISTYFLGDQNYPSNEEQEAGKITERTYYKIEKKTMIEIKLSFDGFLFEEN